ncbi:MAG: hypothetical protein NTV54_13365 [Ignavibacteriales bacterium]|nr:hypothetical protein [Ignavibacteriales bacterium]
MKNNYSETIQAKAAVDGEIQIEWLIPRFLIGEIATTRTVKLTNSNFYGARQYDPSKGTLTITSGDSVTLLFFWNLKMDDSTYLFYQPAFNDGRKWDCLWQESMGIGYRFFFKPQAYRVTGHVRLFEQTGIMYAPEMLFSSCYIYPYRDKSTTISTCATINDPQRTCELYQSLP